VIYSGSERTEKATPKNEKTNEKRAMFFKAGI
jgi:hypothetical protein